jgi:hypothetical protein
VKLEKRWGEFFSKTRSRDIEPAFELFCGRFHVSQIVIAHAHWIENLSRDLPSKLNRHEDKPAVTDGLVDMDDSNIYRIFTK